MSEILKKQGLIIPEHVKRQIEANKAKETPFLRVVDLVANVSAPMPGNITDWPAMIQDQIYNALMKKCVEDKITYTIVDSRCGVDDGVWYVHVTAMWKKEMMICH